MATISLPQLRSYVANCDPVQPLSWPQDPRYVELDRSQAVRGEGGSCVENLLYTILLADATDASCQLFTGYAGTGKTTELYRLKRDLEQHPEERSFVSFLDTAEFLDRYTALSITDMLRIIAFHLDREATRAEGQDPDQTPGYTARFWKWLASDVELKSLGFQAYGASTMLEIKNNPNFRDRAHEALQLRFQAFAEEAREVIEQSVRRLRKARKVERVVLLVDGLEKLTALRPEERARMEESIETVFSSHADWLKLPCHVVYTFPLWLRFQTTDLGIRYDAPIETLPMIKVRQRDGTPFQEGLDKLAEMVERRLPEVASLFGDDWRARLEPLLEASGGYPRDLLRLVRDAITRARAFPISPEVIARVIALLTEEYELVTRLADLDALLFIAREQTLPLGAEKLRATSWLFERSIVLTYRNGAEWYDLHPLVRRTRVVQQRLLVEPTGGGTS